MFLFFIFQCLILHHYTGFDFGYCLMLIQWHMILEPNMKSLHGKVNIWMGSRLESVFRVFTLTLNWNNSLGFAWLILRDLQAFPVTQKNWMSSCFALCTWFDLILLMERFMGYKENHRYRIKHIAHAVNLVFSMVLKWTLLFLISANNFYNGKWSPY